MDSGESRTVGRPARRLDGLGGSAQAGLALLVGILLIALPLYLWRRPHPAPIVTHDSPAADGGSHGGAAIPSAAPPTPPPLPVKLADARVLECHDRGSRRTPPEQCDHVPPFEKALGEAIEAAHECVPADAGAGAIEYVADLSFLRARRPVTLTLPRAGRTFRSPAIAKNCAEGVRARLSTLPVATLPHAHARYKVSVVASYGGGAN